MVNKFALRGLIVSAGAIQHQENPLIFEVIIFYLECFSFSDHEKPPPFFSEIIIQIRMLLSWKKRVLPKFCEACTMLMFLEGASYE